MTAETGDNPTVWYAALGQLIDEVVFVHREDRSIAFVSPSVEQVLGYTVEEFTALNTPALIHPDDIGGATETAMWLRAEPGRSYRSTLRVRKADAGYAWVEIVGRNLLDDPEIEGVLNTLRDISDRRALEEKLLYQATHDDLTGLADRAHLVERIGVALADEPPGTVALLYLDLDHFKPVNDAHGHQAGDDVLKAVARRLRGVVRGNDVAGRIGGDEFLVLCHGVSDACGAHVVARRVHAAAGGSMAIAGTEIDIRLSVGLARAGGSSTTESLMRDADRALYAAKRAGGDRVGIGAESEPR